MKEIYFIRHGETDWNKKNLGQGSRNDIKMNKMGEKQAQKTGKYLNKFRQQDSKFDLIISSPMQRTKKTAEIIAKEIGYTKKIVYMDELKERDGGLVSIGKTMDELEKDPFYDKFFDFIKLYEQLKDPIEQALFDEKNKVLISKIEKKYELESDEELTSRIKKVLKYIEASPFKKILVISHGGTINSINKYLLNTYDSIKGDMKNGSNCHITMYQYDNKKYKLVIPSNTLHLGLV